MGFRADHHLLRNTAVVLSKDSEATSVASDYARSTVSFKSESGAAFRYVEDRHREVTEALGEAFAHLTRLLDGASQEVRASAELYRQLDTEQAVQLDEQYPS